MPAVPADRLESIARDLLMGAGATEHEAASVAEGVVGANLAGHDSHGIIQIPSYIERIEVGHIVCGAPMDVVRETATTMVVDGNWGFSPNPPMDMDGRREDSGRGVGELQGR